MAEAFLGEIRMFGFNFAPSGWALCNGQTIAISQNQALFALIGTYYGGNGTTTFQLPNLQSRFPMHQGQGLGLSPRVLGEVAGVEQVTLLSNNVPAHVHTQPVSNGASSTSRPSGAVPSAGGSYAASSDGGAFVPTTPNSGGSNPVSIMTPFLVVNFCIALTGIFPSRN